MFRDKMKSMMEEQRQGRFNNIGDPGRRARFISTYEEGVESVHVAQGIFAFEKMFGEIDEALADGRDWLVGEFSLANINLIPFVARLNYLGLLSIWTSIRPLVRAWWKRARNRPSFHKAIENKLRPDQISAMDSSGAGIRDRLAERYREIVTPAQRAA
jgi:glutathione S-transferase